MPLKATASKLNEKGKTSGMTDAFSPEYGAGNEVRTRDLNLGKVALYQLSYSRAKGCALW